MLAVHRGNHTDTAHSAAEFRYDTAWTRSRCRRLSQKSMYHSQLSWYDVHGISIFSLKVLADLWALMVWELTKIAQVRTEPTLTSKQWYNDVAHQLESWISCDGLSTTATAKVRTEIKGTSIPTVHETHEVNPAKSESKNMPSTCHAVLSAKFPLPSEGGTLQNQLSLHKLNLCAFPSNLHFRISIFTSTRTTLKDGLTIASCSLS